MNGTFKIPIIASSAEEARRLTFDRHHRERVSHVTDTLDQVQSAIEAKMVRVKENPGLYQDKVDEYIEMLRAIERLHAEGQADQMVVPDAMILHGDIRVEDKSRVCAIETSPKRWLVFGTV